MPQSLLPLTVADNSVLSSPSPFSCSFGVPLLYQVQVQHKYLPCTSSTPEYASLAFQAQVSSPEDPVRVQCGLQIASSDIGYKSGDIFAVKD